MSALGQKWSFVPNQRNGRFAPIADVELVPVAANKLAVILVTLGRIVAGLCKVLQYSPVLKKGARRTGAGWIGR